MRNARRGPIPLEEAVRHAEGRAAWFAAHQQPQRGARVQPRTVRRSVAELAALCGVPIDAKGRIG